MGWVCRGEMHAREMQRARRAGRGGVIGVVVVVGEVMWVDGTRHGAVP